jgi:hypothetical protein
MMIGGFLALLLFGGLDRSWVIGDIDVSMPLIQTQGDGAAPTEGRIFRWELDLRSFAFQLLKGTRRTAIRVARLVRRSMDYWIGWLLGSIALLAAGGVGSTIDRRMLTLGWERGLRAAVDYAWIGLLVFLRLLRDRRVSTRARLLVPIAVLYGVASSGWLRFASSRPLDIAFDLFIVIAASRWFVRQCPDEVVEQHASRVRARAKMPMPIASSEPRP